MAIFFLKISCCNWLTGQEVWKHLQRNDSSIRSGSAPREDYEPGFRSRDLEQVLPVHAFDDLDVERLVITIWLQSWSYTHHRTHQTSSSVTAAPSSYRCSTRDRQPRLPGHAGRAIVLESGWRVNPRTQHPCYSPLTLPQTKNNHLKDKEKSPRQTNKRNVQEKQTRKRASHSSCKSCKHNNTLHTQANCNLESDQNANKRQKNSCNNNIKQLPIIFARSLENCSWSCEFLVSDAHTELLRQKTKKKQNKQSGVWNSLARRPAGRATAMWSGVHSLPRSRRPLLSRLRKPVVRLYTVNPNRLGSRAFVRLGGIDWNRSRLRKPLLPTTYVKKVLG